ncbi:hypothetical protein ACH5RR_028303 [Cinchona calisaya]|uniref:Disease resistance R13L4/SHOC-2-like LRR domain-containing protein n=1 Tax=Cinchona calisaya TaxID=153742 RepID=A0ABD2YND9_9GENT
MLWLISPLSFAFTKVFKVLDLELICLSLDVFPKDVESLVELRYLGVGGEFTHIPPSIENLSNLETFIVKSAIDIISLPDTIWNITKLRHLHVVSFDACWSLPSENLEKPSDLYNLDTFSTLLISLDQVENIMGKIPKVRELQIGLLKEGIIGLLQHECTAKSRITQGVDGNIAIESCRVFFPHDFKRTGP